MIGPDGWPTDAAELDALEAAFDALAQLSPTARDRRIATASADERATLVRARELLDGEPRYARVLDPPVDVAPIALPERVGPYLVTGWIGAGGMGVVYEARREGASEVVALKVVHPSFATPAAVRRFRREAELLATLDHPGIARFHDAGVAAIGPASGEALALPWIALERVYGVPIDVFARDLPLRGRVELVARLAEAVQHAHEKLVVHRDLKPANVLVDAAGHPKVLDFGIARALADEVAATRLTQTGQVVGTLGFMSPEQAAGDSGGVDARTDVWSLGAVLYLLASGRMPHRTDGLALVAALERIRTEDVTRLGEVDRALSGPLETIAMRALERDPAHRYSTAAAFAADLRRYLAGASIHARPDGALVQVRKLARRHRGLAIGLAAGGAALVFLAGTATVVAWRERGLRARADAHAEEARAHAIEARWRAYRASVGEASAALDAQLGVVARRALARAPQEVRGWEWRYLARRTDRSLRAWPAHTGAIRALASGHGLIATGGDDGYMHVWTSSGEATEATLYSVSRVRGLAFSPAGDALLVQSAALLSLCRIRSTGTGAISLETVWSVDATTQAGLGSSPFSPDGARIAVGSAAAFAIGVLDAATGASIGSIALDVPCAASASFAPDGTLHAQLEPSIHGAHATAFDPQSGAARWTVAGEGVRWYPGGLALAKVSGSRIVLFDIVGGRRALELPSANAAGAHGMVDGRIVVGEQDGTIGVWDAATGGLMAKLHGHAGRVVALAVVGDARVASASTDGTVRVWDLLDVDEPFSIAPSTDKVFSSDATNGLEAVVAGGWGSVRVWDAATGAPLWSRVVSRERIIACAFVDGDRTVVAADRNGAMVVVRDEAEGATPSPIPPYGRDTISSSRFASASGAVYVATAAHGLERIAIPTGERRVIRAVRDRAIEAIAAEPESRRIAVGVGAQVVVLDAGRDALDGTRDAGGDVTTVAWGPSGRLFAGLADGTLVAWSPSGGEVVRAPGAGRVLAIAASHDGLRLAVLRGSLVELWALDDGGLREVSALRVEPVNVGGGWVRFSPDDARLAKGGGAAIEVFACGPAERSRERETCRRARAFVALRRAAGAFGDEIERAAEAEGDLRDAIRRQARHDGDQANYLNSNAWGRVRFPDRSSPEYGLALREAERACALWPDQPSMLNTLGLARFRVGDLTGAAIALLRGDALRRASGGSADPIDLAFLAAIEARFGRWHEARALLERAERIHREVPPGSEHLVRLTLLREARKLVGLHRRP